MTERRQYTPAQQAKRRRQRAERFYNLRKSTGAQAPTPRETNDDQQHRN